MVFNIKGPVLKTNDQVNSKIDPVPAFKLPMKRRTIFPKLGEKLDHVIKVAKFDQKYQSNSHATFYLQY